LLGAVGGFFQYQANKAHRAYEIIGKYVGYGSSLADIPYRKYKNYSTIATLSFVGSGFSFLFGTGALVGGFVAGSRKPQGSSMALQQGYGAPMGDPNLQGSMQPQGMQ